jgi:serine/threonine protein phosphatase PrpC
MSFLIEMAAVSDRGLLRTNNEDMALVKEKQVRDNDWTEIINVENIAVFCAVADGLGGHTHGEIASSYVISSIVSFSNSFFKDKSNLYDFNFFKKSFDKYLHDLHQKLIEFENTNPEMNGLGTTLTGILFTPLFISLFNAGDSRVYRLRGGFLNQLSIDHSLISETGIDRIPRNIITNCLGGGVSNMFVDIENVTEKIRKDDLMLICSDGLYGMATQDSIEDVLNKDISVPEKCSNLISLAKTGGGNDNITVVLCTIK